MRLSNAKINHLAHQISDLIERDDSIDTLRDKNDIRLRIKIIITDELRLDDELDREVKRTINSLAKIPPEGSKEWEVLYEKYYAEAMNRRRVRPDAIRRMN
jgi:uncharacterized protein